MTLNGGPFPISDYDDAWIRLRDRVTGDLILLGNRHDQNYLVNIVPGGYDVLYGSQTPGSIAPHNINAVLLENVPLLANGTFSPSQTAQIILKL